MSTILLKTKIHIPHQRGEQVSRPRLIAQLKRGQRGKLTLISASAGFGKTTLLSSWIKATGVLAAWFSVDKEDNDPYRFWFYFANALQSINTNIGKDFLSIITASQSAPNEALLGGLIQNIEETQTRFSFILDDFHWIENQQIQTMLLFLLNHLPSQMHLIISSRADPPWPLARLRSHHELTEIRASELRFRATETTTLLNTIMGLAISKADISRLENRTEGWVVGLQMAAVSMQNRADVSGFIQAFTGTNRFILDYLLEEVLNQQPAEIQDFLLKTSILEQLTGPLCDSVTATASSQAILRRLEQINLFLVPLDDDRLWYRYHHLFAELLRNQLSLTYPEEVPYLHQNASTWLEEQGFIDEPIAHAFAAQDYELAARLCEKFGQGMLQQSRHKTLSTWIEALPADLVQRHPWLCVYQSWTRHWAGMREDGETGLENAIRMLDNTPLLPEAEKNKLGGSIATVRAHYALVNENLSQAIEQAQKALALLPETDYYTPGTAGIALGGAYWAQGQIMQAEKAFANCVSTAMKGGYVYRASSALCYVGMQKVNQAKLKAAEVDFLEALSLAQGASGRRHPIAGYPLAKLAELACEWNQLDQAQALAEEALEHCQLLGHVDLIAEAYAALARVRLASADYAGVEQILARTDQLATETKLDLWAITWLDACRIRAWLATGELEKAARWVRNSGLDIAGEFSFHHDLHHIILLRVLVAQIAADSCHPELDPCFELIARLLAITDEMGWIHHHIQVLILKALALQATNDLNSALQTLRTALKLAEPEGYIRIFIREGQNMEALLQNLHTKKKHNHYLRILLAAYAQDAPQQHALVEPLSPREIEVLQFLITSLSVPEISSELVLSPHTVRSHIKNIYSKLGVNRRMDAIERAKALKLV